MDSMRMKMVARWNCSERSILIHGSSWIGSSSARSLLLGARSPRCQQLKASLNLNLQQPSIEDGRSEDDALFEGSSDWTMGALKSDVGSSSQ